MKAFNVCVENSIKNNAQQLNVLMDSSWFFFCIFVASIQMKLIFAQIYITFRNVIILCDCFSKL